MRIDIHQRKIDDFIECIPAHSPDSPLRRMCNQAYHDISSERRHRCMRLTSGTLSPGQFQTGRFRKQLPMASIASPRTSEPRRTFERENQNQPVPPRRTVKAGYSGQATQDLLVIPGLFALPPDALEPASAIICSPIYLSFL